MKWEPMLAMVGVVALGLWLVAGPWAKPGLPPMRAQARAVELRLGNDRGALEVVEDQSGKSFRLLFRNREPGPLLTEEQVRAVLPTEVFERAVRAESVWLYRVLNITSRGSLIWIAVGFGGQLLFSCRFLVQWLVSERRKQSVIPEAFWWLSLLGGVSLFFYFAWRQDIVGVLGQSSGLVIYARNIRLIHKQRRRAREQAAPPPATASATAPPSEGPGVAG
jgi:lipid-A-disaccharide synthase-like uncharacterized protein